MFSLASFSFSMKVLLPRWEALQFHENASTPLRTLGEDMIKQENSTRKVRSAKLVLCASALCRMTSSKNSPGKPDRGGAC